MSETVYLICGSTSHTSSSCPSEAARELAKPRHTSRARIWPFGDGYVSQLAPHYGKQDGRGQHNVGGGRGQAITVKKGSK